MKTGHIGYIGLGNMGGALARRLVQQQPLTVFDLNRAACRDLQDLGAEVAPDLASLAATCDIIFICLPMSHHVEDVLFGEGGLAGALRPGALIIDQTSGDPSVTRRLAERLRASGHSLVDAPVSGGPKGAEAGDIAIMVGASVRDFSRAEPVLCTISPNIFHAGEVGAGHVAKLANNVLSGGIRMMTMEAVTFAVKNGLSAEMAVEIISKSAGNSDWMQRNGAPLFVEGDLGSAFTLELLFKDIRLACQLGMEADMPMLFANQTRAFCQMAVHRYGGQSQVNHLAHLTEEISDTRFIPRPNGA